MPPHHIRWVPVLRSSVKNAAPRPGHVASRADGYRFAKGQGKPISASRSLPPRNKQFCDFAAGGAGQAFTFDSSRYLNCPSNFIGHDHPNKPANGKRMIRQSVQAVWRSDRAHFNNGNNGTFFNWTGAALGTGAAKQKRK
jgi:hypothetical protein